MWKVGINLNLLRGSKKWISIYTKNKMRPNWGVLQNIFMPAWTDCLASRNRLRSILSRIMHRPHDPQFDKVYCVQRPEKACAD